MLQRWKWAFLCVIAVAAVGCEPTGGGGDPECPEGTVRSGDDCVAVDVDSGVDTDGAVDEGDDPDDGVPADMGGDDPDSGMPPLVLPLIVDEHFAASGYMGDGEAGGITDVADCPMRAGGAGGLCHHFTYTPGEAGWGGVWWQGPAGNWGDAPGIPVPPGATRVQFYAWGAAGGERITLGAGYGPADGFGVETGAIELTTEPTMYTLDLAGVPYERIAGGFSWVTESAGAPIDFYIDDVRYVADPADEVDPCTVTCATARGLAGCEVPGYGACRQTCATRLAGDCAAEAGAWLTCVADGGWACGPDGAPVAAGDCAAARATLDMCEGGGPGAPLPFYLEEHFVMSGYMGGGEVAVADCPGDAGEGGTCWQITWTPGDAPWVGFFFQHPENNWGDLPGLRIAPGATHIRYRVWGATGTERANFAAGIADVDGFGVETGYMALGSEPTDAFMALPEGVAEVAGGFAWFLENPTGAETVTFYLDDVQWRDDAPPGPIDPPMGDGCTDPVAVNYDPAAMADDGSCRYPVTFRVDMSCTEQMFGQVNITGPFCEWCGEGFELSDPDGDGIWEGTWDFQAGPLEYKYMVDGFAQQEDLIDDVQAGDGACAPVTDGANFANRQVDIAGPTVRDEAYGRCGGCDGPIDPPDPPVGAFETVTFDDPMVEYRLIGFGGADDAQVVEDPTGGPNQVARVVKAGDAELWAGTTVATGANDAVGRMPIGVETTRMSVRVWSPHAMIPVRLKIEDATDPTVSVETEAMVMVADEWTTLTFDFANQVPDTAALNPMATYDKASIFFNFGTTGAEAGERVYFFDDLALGEGGGVDPPDPPDPPAGGFETVTFDDPGVEYALIGFGGADDAQVVEDPTGGPNQVARVVKAGDAELWAGTTVATMPNEAVGRMPIGVDTTQMTLRVWSPHAMIPVRLKIEDATDPTVSVETEAMVMVADEWTTLTFDFANQVPDTAALNPMATYDKASIFFNFGTTGAEAGERVYFFDDLALGEGGGVDPPDPPDPPAGGFETVTFDDPGVEYALIGFGGADDAQVVEDPTGGPNQVARVVKAGDAELWAGTTVATMPNDAVGRIPLGADRTRMSVRVWSPHAMIPVRLKIEDATDPTVSVETEAMVMVADEWTTLTFDFANQAEGTAPLNPMATYDKASIFFNFGTTGAEAGERVYFFDDLALGDGGGVDPPDPPGDAGCTDPAASNHDPAAEADDGSCVYPITFRVDMRCTEQAFGQVNITGPFCQWCAEGFELADADGDGVWEGTWDFPAGPFEYKYMVDGFAQQEDLLDDVQAGDGACAPVTDGAGFANRQHMIMGPAVLDETYGQCRACDGPPDPPDPPAGAFEAIDFDDPEVEYRFIGFGGAEDAAVIEDPTGGPNQVARVVKSGDAELWAGTTVATRPNDAVGRIPLGGETTQMSLRVWSPHAMIPVRLKVEDATDPTVSVETEAMVMVADEWTTLTFDFASQAPGTAPLNPMAVYDKASVFFNFGTTGAEAGERVYFFDDLELGDGGGIDPPGQPGCVDPAASNFDPAADADDGSCLYATTFRVDMNCTEQDFGQVNISGPFCEWCAEGFELADADGDGIWEGTWDFPAGPFEYKYMVDGFAQQEDLLDDVIAGDGACAPATNGANFANRVHPIMGPAVLDDTYGQCSACDGPPDPPDPPVGDFETVTFDAPGVDYGFVGFGGAEDAAVVEDPTGGPNQVARVVKSGNAELWAGTTVVTRPNDAVGRMPIGGDATRMSLRVWSPHAMIPVRLKIEDATDPTVSVETEAMVMVANEWTTIVFDFANQAPGTAPLNPEATYDKASIFFNFGTTGAEAGERVYFFDDLALGDGGGVEPPEPPEPPAGDFEAIDFEDPEVEYRLIGFGGAEDSVVVRTWFGEPNHVARVIKSGNAELWAGTTIATRPNDAVGRIPLGAETTRMTMQVWSPHAPIPVRLKVEDATDPTVSVETEAMVMVADEWTTITFDFANQAPGTAPLNPEAVYDRASIFFNFGTTGAEAGERVYFFDDLDLGEGGGVDPPGGAGCTNPGASNFDPAADQDDGSCVYATIFRVDMRCTEQPFAQVNITGPFCGWCAEGFELADPEGDGIWEGAWDFPAGPLEYKYMVDGFAAQEDLLDDVQAGDGACAPVTDGAGFANRLHDVQGPAVLSETYGQCSACDDPVDPPDPPAGEFDAITFQEPGVEYRLIGFGGAEDASVVDDPTGGANQVARVVKSGNAELWAGTTIATGPNDSVPRIPITANNTEMTVRVLSSHAEIQVRLKIEDSTDPTVSVETEATVTRVNEWESLTFDFANQAPGTAPLNPDATYDKVSIFFNFGVTGADAGERIYWFDDIAAGSGDVVPPDPPAGGFEAVTFDDPDVEYGFVGFGGAEDAALAPDPAGGPNQVARVVKAGNAQLWAGTTIVTRPNDAVGRIPLAPGDSRMTAWVWSPHAPIQVRLKVEDATDPTVSVETEATVSLTNEWELLVFDFANEAPGTAPLNPEATYDKASIFFNFGVDGATAGERVYFFDDLEFGGGLNVPDGLR